MKRTNACAAALFVGAGIAVLFAGAGARGVQTVGGANTTTSYIALERAIHARVVAGENPQAIQSEYRAQVLRDQKDPAAVFGWAFAGIEARRVEPGLQPGDWAMEQVLAHDDAGVSHEYARVRFALIQEAHPGIPHPELYKEAEAALRWDPHDDFLRHRLVYDMENDKKTLPQAVAIARQGVAADPHRPKAHSLLASAYEMIWASSNSAAAAQSAVEEFQTYLALAPASDPFRSHAQYLIATIQKEASAKH